MKVEITITDKDIDDAKQLAEVMTKPGFPNSEEFRSLVEELAFKYKAIIETELFCKEIEEKHRKAS